MPVSVIPSNNPPVGPQRGSAGGLVRTLQECGQAPRVTMHLPAGNGMGWQAQRVMQITSAAVGAKRACSFHTLERTIRDCLTAPAWQQVTSTRCNCGGSGQWASQRCRCDSCWDMHLQLAKPGMPCGPHTTAVLSQQHSSHS